eukprot:2707841-Rhodomonas_salina.1
MAQLHAQPAPHGVAAAQRSARAGLVERRGERREEVVVARARRVVLATALLLLPRHHLVERRALRLEPAGRGVQRGALRLQPFVVRVPFRVCRLRCLLRLYWSAAGPFPDAHAVCVGIRAGWLCSVRAEKPLGVG